MQTVLCWMFREWQGFRTANPTQYLKDSWEMPLSFKQQLYCITIKQTLAKVTEKQKAERENGPGGINYKQRNRTLEGLGLVKGGIRKKQTKPHFCSILLRLEFLKRNGDFSSLPYQKKTQMISGLWTLHSPHLPPWWQRCHLTNLMWRCCAAVWNKTKFHSLNLFTWVLLPTTAPLCSIQGRDPKPSLRTCAVCLLLLSLYVLKL